MLKQSLQTCHKPQWGTKLQHNLKEISDPRQKPLKYFQGVNLGQMCRADAHSFLWALLLSQIKLIKKVLFGITDLIQAWLSTCLNPVTNYIIFYKWKMKYLFRLFLELSVAPSACWMTQSSKRWWHHILRPEGKRQEGGTAEIIVLPQK